MKDKINIRFFTLLAIVLAVGAWRIVLTTGHTPISNFMPIGAMALFGGAHFSSKIRAYIFPLLTLFLSDFVLMNTVYAEHATGFLYEGWIPVYLAFACMVLIGSLLIQKVTIKNVALGAFSAAVAHFLIVDFAVWFGGGIDMTTGLPYTRDFQGLIKCYVMALPYFKNMLLGNIVYGAILFGGFELAQTYFPVLQVRTANNI